jgi:ADP-ribose pyrophosphatase YjhB (NUDIX family)
MLYLTVHEVSTINQLCIQHHRLFRFYGFKFHHAEGDEATMLLWLPTNSESVVPPFATHHCGVGCALTVKKGDDTKILLVKEKSKQSAWKLPGGYVNLGEDFSAAAVREVFEETGVKSEFESVLTVRHSHKIQFGRSDVYIICRMKALSEDIQIDSEIEDAKWISLQEFKGFNKHPMLDRVADLLSQDAKGLKEETMESTIPGRLPFKLYSPK